jgi:hypothetical protein
MSIQINIGDHVSDYPSILVPVPFKHQWATKWARNQAKVIAANVKTADKYFKSLGKRSLTQLLADRRIWINYARDLQVRGIRQDGSNDIGIGDLAYLRGKEVVLATLIHELAHIAGAPGGESRAAEEALIHCRLGKKSELETGINDPSTPYDPDVKG